MPLQGPASVTHNPLAIMRADLRAERGTRVPFPPGLTGFSLRRTQQLSREPLPLLLGMYERFGPVFTVRVLHHNVVFMIGPEANHHILVSHARNFTWREGHMRDLIALLGDGLLTVDGDFHRRSRQIMLPAFHREQIARSTEVMVAEIEAALERWRVGQRVDLYAWTRRLALRIAMRAIFGLDPDGGPARRVDAASLFERALGFYGRDYALQALRGPGTPWADMRRARGLLDALIYSQIEERGRSGARGSDVLSLLLDAHDQDGAALTRRQIRDEMMTLLFAGHDTTTSTVAFLFYELAANPAVTAALVQEQDLLLPGRAAPAAELSGPSRPLLEMAIDETLRKYPPAWVGPRHSVADFEFAGVPVPGDIYVNYSAWVSHHLADVFPDPQAFRPSRFAPEARAALPRGAYVPFGGGSRTCLGMRFGQMEIRAIAGLILARHTLEPADGFALSIRQMPTISPRAGLPMVVRERSAGGPALLSGAA